MIFAMKAEDVVHRDLPIAPKNILLHFLISHPTPVFTAFDIDWNQCIRRPISRFKWVTPPLSMKVPFMQPGTGS